MAKNFTSSFCVVQNYHCILNKYSSKTERPVKNKVHTKVLFRNLCSWQAESRRFFSLENWLQLRENFIVLGRRPMVFVKNDLENVSKNDSRVYLEFLNFNKSIWSNILPPILLTSVLFIPYLCLLIFGILVTLVAWFSFRFFRLAHLALQNVNKD